MNRYLYIPVAAILTLYVVSIPGNAVEQAYETVGGNWLAPYQYRILFPYAYVLLASVTGDFAAMWGYYFIALALFGALMAAWLGYWAHSDRVSLWSLLSLILVAGFSWFHSSILPWSLTEGLFWLVALLLLVNGRVSWLILLIPIATLNRETAIFLPLLVLLVTRRWQFSILLVGLWALTYGAIRLYYGDVPLHLSIADIWEWNTQTFRFWNFLFGLVLFGWLPVLAVLGYREAPVFLQRVAWAAPPYIAAIAVFGIWREFRLFIPLLPVAIPLMMSVQSREMLLLRSSA